MWNALDYSTRLSEYWLEANSDEHRQTTTKPPPNHHQTTAMKQLKKTAKKTRGPPWMCIACWVHDFVFFSLCSGDDLDLHEDACSQRAVH
jgi:hypothetical protein